MQNFRNRLSPNKNSDTLQTMKLIERDRMPYEVATEMACSSWCRRTNRERKMLRDARQVEWCSEAERKPLAEKLANRMRNRPIAWLGREVTRAEKRRRGVQQKYEALMRLEQTPIVERFVAALNLRAAQIDLVIDVAQDEIRYRLDLTHGITKPANGALMWPGFGYTRTWVSGPEWVSRRTEFPRWVACRLVMIS